MADSRFSFLRQVPRNLLKYPVEMLLSITFFFLAMILTGEDYNDQKYHLLNTLLCFVPLFVLTFILNIRKLKIPYYISYFLWVPPLFFYKEPGSELIVAYLLAAIALLIGKGKMDNASYARHTVHVVKHFALACIIGMVLVALIFAIILSIKALFSTGEEEPFFELAARMSLFVGFVIVPMLSCVFVGEEEAPDARPSSFLEILLNWLITPALLIYTVILYAYSLWILFRWQLPDGGVAYMVLSYMEIALVCYLLGYALEKRPFWWFFNWFTFISAPAVVLLWVGTLRRICDYGFTEARVYLLGAVILITVFSVLIRFERTRDFRRMAIIIGLAALLLLPIAKPIGEASQKHRAPASEEWSTCKTLCHPERSRGIFAPCILRHNSLYLLLERERLLTAGS